MYKAPSSEMWLGLSDAEAFMMFGGASMRHACALKNKTERQKSSTTNVKATRHFEVKAFSFCFSVSDLLNETGFEKVCCLTRLSFINMRFQNWLQSSMVTENEHSTLEL